MPSRLFCLLLGISLPWAGLEAATVYRSTDAQGNVVFSDQPVGNGERIELKPLTVVPSPEPATAPTPAGQQSADSATPRDGDVAAIGPFMPYSTFRILSPQNGQTLPTGRGVNVQVELDIDPDLRDDHRVRLLLDGEVSQSAMHTKVFMLTNLDRGEHVLQAELLDADGQVRHRSAPVTLFVQRGNVGRPANSSNSAGT